MTELPAAVRTTIATLRTAATWLPDDERELLLGAARDAESGGWQGACCPICDETWCDAGCPLEDLRAELMRPAEPDTHDDELRAYAEAKRSAAGSLRTMSGLLQGGTPMEATLGNLASALAEQLDAPSPFDWDEPHQSTRLPERCYDASFGRVHVRPGCRC
jgi:hypothetical protein